MILVQGGNTIIPIDQLTVRIITGKPADISSFRLYASGKVNGDSDMVFYGQKTNDDNTVRLTNEGTQTTFAVDLPRLSTSVQKLAFTVTCDASKNISSLGQLSIQIEHNNELIATCPLSDLSSRSESALILGEMYRHNQNWKFRFVAQGFNGGLQPLAEHFGVEIASTPTPTPTPTPQAQPSKINLSKISLTKASPTISLTKRNDYGLIKINLNWHQGEHSKPSGFFGSLLNSSNDGAIDLDLGAFVRLKQGKKEVIQALGKRFGDLNNEPYVYLLGDDRSGSSQSGEWLHINGQHWNQISEVLIYAFIYDGIPNWSKTDGAVSIFVENEPTVETQLTEGNSRKRMCAIARLINENGVLKVERLNQYFSGHSEMDEAFSWGFRWRAGSK